MQFIKLFNSILDSTVWQLSKESKIVWITMMAMSDRNGEIHASIPGLATRAGVSIEECESALECFSGPDKYSRTKEHGGRRIEPIDGGWRLLNHGKYRALLSAEERREYNRRKQAEHRQNVKDKSAVSAEVNNGQCESAHNRVRVSEAESEKKEALAKTPRERDPIFDALAEVSGFDLKEMNGSAGGMIAKARKCILESTPNVDRDEIFRRAHLLRKRWPTAEVTPTSLAKWWSKINDNVLDGNKVQDFLREGGYIQ